MNRKDIVHWPLSKETHLAKEKDSHVSEDELPTWPYLVRKEFLAAIIVTIILLVWSIALNAPLEDPSDPSVTPNPAKAPWYFLGLTGDACIF